MNWKLVPERRGELFQVKKHRYGDAGLTANWAQNFLVGQWNKAGHGGGDPVG